ncbi:hypothetical protein TSUD_47280 [Trifolium subterraneum]|nr:hypothetical protein TSUD_47280 [Trifolium subterraneum]
MGLIKDERIPVPQHYHQTLERIDDVYVNRYCKPKPEETTTAPVHPAAPHGVTSIDPMLQNWFHHTWDQNTANHRADIAMYEAMYRMSLQQPLDEPSMFQTHIAWPGDRPNFVGGAGVEAGTDGDRAGAADDDIDEAAANAFVDSVGEDEQYEEMSD